MMAEKETFYMRQKRIFFLLTALMLLLSGCAPKEAPGASSSAAVVTLTEGVWPESDFTDGLPCPDGTVEASWTDEAKTYCAVQISQPDEDDFSSYLDALREAGFAEVIGNSEAVQGADTQSTNLLLCDGTRSIGLSCTADTLMLYITFAE